MRIPINNLNARQIQAFESFGFTASNGCYILNKEDVITLSQSNAKYIPTDSQKFLIWNLPAEITCPFASDGCKEFCYAKKAERMYPSVLPSRLYHLELSKSVRFVDMMIISITYYLNTPSYKKADKVDFRLHESGDFYSMEYVSKWLAIMSAFQDVSKLRFFTYTKSFIFFESVNLAEIKNFTLSGSIDSTTTENQRMLCDALGIQKYIAVPKYDIHNYKGHHICKCTDCGKCRYCINNHFGKVTVVAIH